MTVNPGFGGQRFIEAVVPKIRALREEIVRRGLDVDIEVDGGIAPDTAPIVVGAGANVLVAGSAVFASPGKDYRGGDRRAAPGGGARGRGRRVNDVAKEISAPWWARNPHFQTTWGRLGRSRRLVTFRREVLTTPDDDDLVLDHVDGPAGAPRVLLLHGLEGSSYSVYMQGLAQLLARAGWQATALNFRSCARDPERISRTLPNRQPRLYHSGETGDLDFVVRTLAAREPSATLYAVGVSLGGNVLLEVAGRAGRAQPHRGGGHHLGAVRSARGGAAPRAARGALLRRHVLEDAARPRRWSCASAFPRWRTAWIRSASRARAPSSSSTTRRPRRCTASRAPTSTTGARARSTTWSASRCRCSASAAPTIRSCPPRCIERARQRASDDVEMVTTPWGGHAAFIAGRWPWKPLYWAEERAVEWLTSRPI